MNVSKQIRIFLLVGIVGLGGLELGEWLLIPGVHSFISTAEAIVGRPLTPVSVAGVARRTVRRCAVGVYNCKMDLKDLPDTGELPKNLVSRSSFASSCR